MSADQFKDLRIQAEIKDVEDSLVAWIEDALDNKEYKKLKESQFRNAVQVAATASSPKVVQNFLRYQMGREDKWGKGPNALAQQIILDIDDEKKLKGTAKKIAETVQDDLGVTIDVKAIWMDLIRRYLGYGSRYLKYLNPEN